VKSAIGAPRRKEDISQLRFVGIELGGTNYNVAIGSPVVNNRGDIIDFNIHKRSSGITYTDPSQALAEIIEFVKASSAENN
jgi:hypothetical protein